jgi:predicted adenine nucleotide alpha hydrolase (AANH) superfamily ATPase
MKVFLHCCCAPCLIYPFSLLKNEGADVTAFFYNPNIHPFREYKKRLDSVKNYCTNQTIPLVADNQYDLVDYLRKIVFHESTRCEICYSIRLERTVQLAKDFGFDAFTTTLLYSKYQRHEAITSLCKTMSSKLSLPFLYYDFRAGWQTGVDKAIELNIYRQPYCGCIYSEQERFDRSLKKSR